MLACLQVVVRSASCQRTKSFSTLKEVTGSALYLAAYLTDYLGVYAEVGYEWVDKADVSAGGANAEVDFSSLVVSAGLMTSF